MVNVERIKQKLEEFVQATPIPCEMCGELPCECDLRQRSFWGGQETAEEEERKMIEVEPDRFKFTPEQQEMADDWMGEQCEQSL